MLPWETLRRLLGLPSEMGPPSSVELVQMALEQPRRARLIGMGLTGRAPAEAPSGMVLAALDKGELAPELAAELLGCVGHRCSYEALRSMLWDPASASAASAAAVAMAKLLGRRAQADLCLALRLAPAREGREGAVLGLMEVGDPAAVATIARAAVLGHIRARLAARCGAQLPFFPELWLGLLEGEAAEERRLGTELVYVLVRKKDADSAARLRALGERGREAVRSALLDEQLYMLPDKRDALTAFVDDASC